MDIANLALKLGKGALGECGPVGKLAVLAINEFLPSEEKVDESSTGDEVIAKIQKLSPEKQAELAKQKLQLEETRSDNWVEVQRLLADSSKNGKGYRGKIAMLMAVLVAVVITSLCVTWCINVWKNGTAPSWDAIMGAMVLPSMLLRSHFGLSSEEISTSMKLGAGTVPAPKMGEAIAGRIAKMNFNS